MKQLHGGLDYKLYKVYIWGGLSLIVIYILVSILAFDADSLPGPQAFLVILTPLLLWVAGILNYWWWVFLFKNNKELEALAREGNNQAPDIQALKSWNTLHHAMALNGGDIAELVQNGRKAQRLVLFWYSGLNVLVAWVCGPVILGLRFK